MDWGKVVSIKGSTNGTNYDPIYWITIKTTTTEIKVGIENYKLCCEHWTLIPRIDDGTPITYDDWVDECLQTEFPDISKSIIGKSITGVCINYKKKSSYDENNFIMKDEFNNIFVDICFESNPTLEIFAACFHNGYYSHDVFFKWEGVDQVETL